MNATNNARERGKEPRSDTIELLGSLYKAPDESTANQGAISKHKRDGQQRMPVDHLMRQARPSSTKIDIGAIKEKTQARKPAAPMPITSKDSRIKIPGQERRRKTVTREGHIPEIGKYGAQKIPESRIVIDRHPTVLERDVCPSERNTFRQRRSGFSFTILSLGLPFIVGFLGTFLGVRYAPVAAFGGNQEIELAKGDIVERPAPMNLTVSAPTASVVRTASVVKTASVVRTTSAARTVTGERVSEAQTPEPPRPIKPEDEKVGGAAFQEVDTAVFDTPQGAIVTARQAAFSVPSEFSTPSQTSGEAAITITSQEDASRSYPYTIYLGSFKNIDRAQKAVSIFREKGLSPYWVKVDLGEKGVWYRVLAGYFQTKDEAQAFIEEHQITDGKSRHVVYANLIGPYRSDEELNVKSLSLFELGYCPYVIKGVDGESLLFTGAFYYKTDAERERIELAAMGIQAQLVKR